MSKTFQEILRNISLVLLVLPFTIIALFLMEGDRTIICGIDPNRFGFGWILFLVIFALIVLNVLSNTLPRFSKSISLLTGVFFFISGISHLFRIFADQELMVLGISISNEISGTLAAVLIVFSALLVIPKQSEEVARPINLLEMYEKFRNNISRLTPYSAIILGIIFCIVIAVPIVSSAAVISLRILPAKGLFDPFEIWQLTLVGIVGAQGSVVSMLIRIRNLGNVSQSRSFSLFINSAVKPFIGLSLAHLSYFLFKSGFFVLPEQGSKDIYLFVSFAFIAGFSERISKDILIPTDEKNDLISS